MLWLRSPLPQGEGMLLLRSPLPLGEGGGGEGSSFVQRAICRCLVNIAAQNASGRTVFLLDIPYLMCIL